MRRRVLVVGPIVIAALAVLAAVAAANGRSVSVTPATGREQTRFAVRFRAPDRAGRQGTIWRRYDVDATGPAGRRGCVSQISAPVTQAATGARVRVKLGPTGSGRWCAGTFHGVVEETETPICSGYRLLCPLFIVLVRRVGKFTFQVR